MNLKRSGAALGIAAVAAMGVTACSDDNSGSSASGSSSAASEAPGAKVTGVDCGGKDKLKASGSTAQNNAMNIFRNDYATTCGGHSLDYNGNGSGSGIKEFNGKQSDFGGSDSPLKEEEATASQERCGSEAWNLPVVFGPISVAYNLGGVKDLALSAPTMAKIFNGQIKKWNDDELKKENPGKELPDSDITVIYRKGESGTTDNFQKYLESASDGAWGKGAGKAFNGGVGEGAEGSEGVAGAVKQTEGTISYMEWSFAKSSGLSEASVVTSAGPEPVAISPETVGKTISGAKLKKEGSNDLQLDTASFYKPASAGAYPIVLATYEIVCSKYPDAETGKAVKAFLQTVTAKETQAKLEDKGYAPVPDSFRTKLNTAIAALS